MTGERGCCMCCQPSRVSSVPKLSCWASFQVSISVCAASHPVFPQSQNCHVGHHFWSVSVPVLLAIPCFLSPKTVMLGIVSGQYHYQCFCCQPSAVCYPSLSQNCHVRNRFRSVSASVLLTILFIIPVCPQTMMSGIISGQHQHLHCLPSSVYYYSLSPNCHVGHHFRSVPVPVLLAISCLLSQSVPEPSCWVSFQVSINVSACFF